MARYNPFEDKYQSENPNTNWFLKSAVKISILGGLSFGAYMKLRGPTGRLLNNIFENRAQELARREVEKHSDTMLDKLARPYPEIESRQYQVRETAKVLDLPTEQYTVNRINNLEKQLIDVGDDLLNDRTIKAEFKSLGGYADELFSQLRYKSLFEFYSIEADAQLASLLKKTD